MSDENRRKREQDERVDNASRDSFPASDAPSSWAGVPKAPPDDADAAKSPRPDADKPR